MKIGASCLVVNIKLTVTKDGYIPYPAVINLGTFNATIDVILD